jgi:hypothetical protein
MLMDPPCRLEQTVKAWKSLWQLLFVAREFRWDLELVPGKWHHLLVSYDENASDDYELKIYLDGKLSGFSAELGGSLQVETIKSMAFRGSF